MHRPSPDVQERALAGGDGSVLEANHAQVEDVLSAQEARDMQCRLVMEDWRKTGQADSIYNTPLGVELTMGDMHSGTTFPAVVELPKDVMEEIKEAWLAHGAYPVFRLVPTLMEGGA